jgi:hypothetical protein
MNLSAWRLEEGSCKTLKNSGRFLGESLAFSDPNVTALWENVGRTVAVLVEVPAAASCGRLLEDEPTESCCSARFFLFSSEPFRR